MNWLVPESNALLVSRFRSIEVTLKTSVARVGDALLRSSIARFIGDQLWVVRSQRVDAGFFSAKHIFVVGCGHSGTSLLLARLDNHSKVVAIAGESRFFQYDSFRRSMMLRGWVKQWVPKLVLAEKTPVHVRYCSEIKRVFPNAKIVGICRNPLDVVASLYLRHERDLNHGICRWKKDNRTLLTEDAAGNISCIVRYEDVVTDPEGELRKIQIACELDVESGLGSFKGKKRNWYASGNRPVSDDSSVRNLNRKRQHQINQPIFDGRGKYQEVLSPEQIEIVRRETREIASELGYSASPGY